MERCIELPEGSVTTGQVILVGFGFCLLGVIGIRYKVAWLLYIMSKWNSVNSLLANSCGIDDNGYGSTPSVVTSGKMMLLERDFEFSPQYLVQALEKAELNPNFNLRNRTRPPRPTAVQLT